MDFGYVRVSTKEQNPDRQIKKLLELGIDQRNIYVEKKSGHTFCREVYDMLVIHGVVHAVSGAFRFLSAQHHFRVVQEIAANLFQFFRCTFPGIP